MDCSLPPSDSGSEPPPPSDSGDEPPMASGKPKVKAKLVKKRRSARVRRYEGDSMTDYILSPANWNFDDQWPLVDPKLVLPDDIRHFFMEVYCPRCIAPLLPEGNTTTSIDEQTGWNLSKDCTNPDTNWSGAITHQLQEFQTVLH